MTVQPAVRLQGVTKRYGDHLVFEGIDLEVHRGSVTAVIGPSGAGKSTLLRAVNFIEPADSGRVTIDDLTIECDAKLSRKELVQLRRRVGMVFQSFNLFPHMTLLRNVALAQERTLGRSKRDAEERARSLLDRVGLAQKVDAYPSRCSGGQQQRVAIARALALEPSVMLFDEVTSALDPELGMEVLRVMKELANDGMTMIVVTHEMHFARDVGDHLVVMADGAIVEEGKPAVVMDDPQHPRTQRFLHAALDR
jgi:polar amino acid transport system ATP-binding protein